MDSRYCRAGVLVPKSEIAKLLGLQEDENILGIEFDACSQCLKVIIEGGRGEVLLDEFSPCSLFHFPVGWQQQQRDSVKFRYLGYETNLVYDSEFHYYHGRIEGISDIVSFHAPTLFAARNEFHHSVDDYKKFCQKQGKPPEKPSFY